MIKITKACSIIMIVLSLLLCVGGFISSDLSEKSRGSKITSGYMKGGTYVAVDEYVLNADKEKEETFKAVSVFCYVFAGIFFCGGIALIARGKRMDSAEIIRRHGTILEKEKATYESVVVEFDDNSRKKLIVEYPVIVTKGDKGIIGYKSNLLVEFTKEI